MTRARPGLVVVVLLVLLAVACEEDQPAAQPTTNSTPAGDVAPGEDKLSKDQGQDGEGKDDKEGSNRRDKDDKDGNDVAACPAANPGEVTASPITFEDVTTARGLDEPLLGMFGHAAATGDVNGDGWPDLFVGSFSEKPDERYQERGASGPAPDRLLLGGPDGFTLAEGFPVLEGRSSGAVFADLDGDGDLDLVVARNANDGPGAGETVVLENLGGSFQVVAGLVPGKGARGIGVLDHDGDGDLDLFVAEDRFTGSSSALLRNDGAFDFADVTSDAGLPGDIAGFGVAAADLTADGRPDLFVAGANRMFVNDGGGSFREADSDVFQTEVYGKEDDVTGVAVGDVNRDGLPDLVLGPHYNSTLDRGCEVPVRLFLHRGAESGDPVFEDVTEEAGIPGLPNKAPHVELADFDNDGWPDLLATASAADGSRPVILRHEGLDGAGIPHFSAPADPGDEQYWVTGVTSDFDADGVLDVFLVAIEPARPSLLLRGQGPAGRYLRVEVGPNAAGPGAVVEVYRAGQAGDPDALLASREVVIGQGYAAGGPSVVHVGLGDEERADVVVRPAWDGEQRTEVDVASGRTLRFPEDFGS